MSTLQAVTHVENIRYDQQVQTLYIIDQTLLPNEEKVIPLRTAEEMYDAIRTLKVRGAPAIGICAAYCLYALARTIPEENGGAFLRRLESYGSYLNSSRPTAVNLSWALGEMLRTARAHAGDPREALLEALWEKAKAIHEDDIEKCTRISEYGLSLLKDGDGILTHCNAGTLATARYGTAHRPRPAGTGVAGTSGLRRRDPASSCRGPGSPPLKFKGGSGCHPYLRQYGLPRDEKRLGTGQPGGLRPGGRQRRHRQQDRHQRRGHSGQALRHPLLCAGAHLHH